MKSLKQNSFLQALAIITGVVCLEAIIIPVPALAHHPLDGRLPANLFEGLLSGFGHPVIGLDHLAFVLASGLIAFVVATAISMVFLSSEIAG